MATDLRLVDGQQFQIFDQGNTKVSILKTESDKTSVLFGNDPTSAATILTASDSSLTLSSGLDLLLADNQNIGGSSTATLNIGKNGDTINLNVSGVTYNLGTINSDVDFAENVTLNFDGDTGSRSLIFKGIEDSTGEVAIKASGEDFVIYDPQDANKEWFKIVDQDEKAYVFGNLVWHEGNDGTGSGLDQDKLDGKHSTEFVKRIDLSSQVQTSSYRKSVIALCELTNSASPDLNSWSAGLITFHRSNGLYNDVKLEFIMSKRYNQEVPNYSGLLQGYASSQIRPCTFIYDGIKYGGIEVYISNAEQNYVEFLGNGNFIPFGIDYYNTQDDIAINTEIQNSLNFDDPLVNDYIYHNDNKIWHEGNDGQASGLDADLLDGLDSTQFVRSDDDDTLTGLYIFSNAQDASLTTDGAITVGDTSSVNLTIDPNEIMARNNEVASYLNINREGGDVKINSSISADELSPILVGSEQYKVWHEGNDGQDSGLDADLLDGLNSTSFLRSDVDQIFNSNSNANGFYISRLGSSTKEYLRFGLEDIVQHIDYRNDEVSSRIEFSLTNTDMEAGGGTNANSGTIKFTQGTTGTQILVSNNKVWHEGNDGQASGLDADLLDGMQPDSTNVQSTIVQRDQDGNFTQNDIQLNAATFSPSTSQDVITINNPSGGETGIKFNSGINANSDYQYIKYYDDLDDYKFISSDSTENSALVIGVENDGNTATSDTIVLKQPYKVVLDANALAIGQSSDGTQDNNIQLLGSISSEGYVSGPNGKGWKISRNGKAEFQDIVARGTIRTQVFQKDTISAVGGTVFVTNAGSLDINIDQNQTIIKVKDNTLPVTGFPYFVRLRDFVNDQVQDEIMKATAFDNTTNEYTVVRQQKDTTAYSWNKGIAVVQIQNSLMLYANPTDSNAAYMDVVEYDSGSTQVSNLYNTKVRLGNLKGIVDNTVGLNSSDVYGLYADGAYLKGTIVQNAGEIGGWTIGTDYLSKEQITLDQQNNKIYIGSGNYKNEDTSFYVDNSGQFSLKDKLYFEDNDLNVIGTVTVTEGSNVQTVQESTVSLPKGQIYYFKESIIDSITKTTVPKGIENIPKLQAQGYGLSPQENNIQNLYGHVDDITTIDGGKIFTNSITQKKIDVDDLFAQNIVINNSGKIHDIESSGLEQFNGFYLDQDGNFQVGKNNDNYIKWDKSSGFLEIKGIVTLSSSGETVDSKISQIDKIINELPYSTQPKRLLIYYGYPSGWRTEEIGWGSGHLQLKATDIATNFDIVVLADIWDIDENGIPHSDHDDTMTMIDIMKEVNPFIEIFSYIELGDRADSAKFPMDKIQFGIDRSKEMGFTGIFLDEFGFDYAVSRDRMIEAVKKVHDAELEVFGNGWNNAYYFGDNTTFPGHAYDLTASHSVSGDDITIDLNSATHVRKTSNGYQTISYEMITDEDLADYTDFVIEVHKYDSNGNWLSNKEGTITSADTSAKTITADFDTYDAGFWEEANTTFKFCFYDPEALTYSKEVPFRILPEDIDDVNDVDNYIIQLPKNIDMSHDTFDNENFTIYSEDVDGNFDRLFSVTGTAGQDIANAYSRTIKIPKTIYSDLVTAAGTYKLYIQFENSTFDIDVGYFDPVGWDLNKDYFLLEGFPFSYYWDTPFHSRLRDTSNLFYRITEIKNKWGQFSFYKDAKLTTIATVSEDEKDNAELLDMLHDIAAWFAYAHGIDGVGIASIHYDELPYGINPSFPKIYNTNYKNKTGEISSTTLYNADDPQIDPDGYRKVYIYNYAYGEITFWIEKITNFYPNGDRGYVLTRLEVRDKVNKDKDGNDRIIALYEYDASKKYAGTDSWQDNYTIAYNEQSYIMSYLSKTSNTYIDGGNIYTNSIKQYSIDTQNLFAEDIILNNTGSIRNSASTSASSFDGFYFDQNGNFQIGNNLNNYLKWDGTSLEIKGNLKSEDSTSISSFDGFYLDSDGDFQLGKNNGNHVIWDKSEGELEIQGKITVTEGSNVQTVDEGGIALPEGQTQYFQNTIIDLVNETVPEGATSVSELSARGYGITGQEKNIQELYGHINDKTTIDGGKIYTDSITQSQIDQEQIFTKYFTLNTGGQLLTKGKNVYKDGIKGTFLDDSNIEIYKDNTTYFRFDTTNGIDLQAYGITFDSLGLAMTKGSIDLGNNKIVLNDDGTGHLANEKIVWDANGDTTTKGKIILDGGYLVTSTKTGYNDNSQGTYIDQFGIEIFKDTNSYVRFDTTNGFDLKTANVSIDDTNGININKGNITLSTDKIILRDDGSGVLADGNISWEIDGTLTIDGSGTFTGQINASSGNITGDLKVKNTLSIDNGSTMKFGINADGISNDGLYINSENYWYSDGTLKIGNGSKYIKWDNTDLDIVGKVTVSEGSNVQTIDESGIALPEGQTQYFQNTIIDLINKTVPEGATSIEELSVQGYGLTEQEKNIQQLYGHTNNLTTIDGGKIYTDSITQSQIDQEQLFTKYFTVKTGGAIHSDGKNTFGSTTPGFWLGDDNGTHKFNIGDASEYFKWDGSNLEIQGTLKISDGTSVETYANEVQENARTDAEDHADDLQEQLHTIVSKNLPNGVPIGGILTGKFEINTEYGGSSNAGEIYVPHMKYIHPNGTVTTILGDTYIATDIEGQSSTIEHYIVFIADDESNFSFYNSTHSTKYFVDQTYDSKNDKWYYYVNNLTPTEFSFESNYQVVAKISGSSQIDYINYYQQVIDDVTAYKQMVEPKDGAVQNGNIQAGKTVTGTGGSTTLPTNGNKKIGSFHYSFGTGTSNNNGAESGYVQIDLGQQYKISKHLIYFWSGDDRYYYFKLKFSNDGTNWFYAVGTPDNNGWQISKQRINSEQKLNPTVIKFEKPITQRYWRLYQNGNTVNSFNHIYEWETFTDLGYQVEIDGNLLVEGTIRQNKVDVQDLFAQDISLTGSMCSNNKTLFTSTEAGFWLGKDTDNEYKFNLGNDANYLKWDGEQLILSGDIDLDVGYINSDGSFELGNFLSGSYIKKNIQENSIEIGGLVASGGYQIPQMTFEISKWNIFDDQYYNDYYDNYYSKLWFENNRIDWVTEGATSSTFAITRSQKDGLLKTSSITKSDPVLENDTQQLTELKAEVDTTNSTIESSLLLSSQGADPNEHINFQIVSKFDDINKTSDVYMNFNRNTGFSRIIYNGSSESNTLTFSNFDSISLNSDIEADNATLRDTTVGNLYAEYGNSDIGTSEQSFLYGYIDHLISRDLSTIGDINCGGDLSVNDINPTSNNSASIGSSNNYFKSIYAVTINGTTINGDQVYGAVYNDYQEFRIGKEKIKPGHIAIIDKDGKLKKCNKDRQKNIAGVVSDVFGFAIGEIEGEINVPIQVAGRVLIYQQDRDKLKIGEPLVQAKDGTARRLKWYEKIIMPWIQNQIVGYVDEMPNYEKWGTDKVKVDNRVWVRVR